MKDQERFNEWQSIAYDFYRYAEPKICKINKYTTFHPYTYGEWNGQLGLCTCNFEIVLFLSKIIELNYKENMSVRDSTTKTFTMIASVIAHELSHAEQRAPYGINDFGNDPYTDYIEESANENSYRFLLANKFEIENLFRIQIDNSSITYGYQRVHNGIIYDYIPVKSEEELIMKYLCSNIYNITVLNHGKDIVDKINEEIRKFNNVIVHISLSYDNQISEYSFPCKINGNYIIQFIPYFKDFMRKNVYNKFTSSTSRNKFVGDVDNDTFEMHLFYTNPIYEAPVMNKQSPQ